MKTFAITDVGQKRVINEDYFLCSEKSIGTFPNMFIVADGLGGHNAGDVASKFCIEEFIAKLKGSSEKTLIAKIETSLKETNDAMLAKSLENPAYKGMGSTFVMTTIYENLMYVANVGDSRLYKYNAESMIQVTQDHSLVEEMIQRGDIKREEARYHPNKNVITRALGVNTQIDIDFFESAFEQGEIILICSDGLTNMLDDREIHYIIKENKDNLNACGHQLVNRANENGGKDNITIILIAY